MARFRTGNPQIDMVLALLLPLLIKFVLSSLPTVGHWLHQAWSHIWNKDSDDDAYYERRIVYKTYRDAWGDMENDSEDTQNSILIKAIDLYLHQHVSLPLTRATVDLTSTEDQNATIGQGNNDDYYYWYDSDNEDDDNDDNQDNSLVGALAKYQLVQKPPFNEWHDLGQYATSTTTSQTQSSPGQNGLVRTKPNKDNDKANETASVRLRMEYYGVTKDGNETPDSDMTASQQQVKTYFLQSTSGAAIDAFLDKAYQSYLTELRKLEDHSRYFYELKSSSSNKKDSDSASSNRVYTRYRLSEEKTFASLFFQQKQSLLKLIEHFTKRTGKYQIPGYPHKLGLLLSGCPGSGKTSFIKALAQHTGRSIVNVPLARVQTNAELMAIFNHPKKQIEGQSMPQKLDFKDVIFVMEDVDAASHIVKRRDGKIPVGNEWDEPTSNPNHDDNDDETATGRQDSMPRPKSVWHLFLESNDSDCKELVKLLIEKSDRLKQTAADTQILTGTVQRLRALPGLGLVGGGPSTSDSHPSGDNNREAVEKIGSDALCTVQKVMNDTSTLDRFLGAQARLLKTRIEQGVPVDDSFVNAMLGTNSLEHAAATTMQLERVSEHEMDRTIPRGSLDMSALTGHMGTNGLLAEALLKNQANGGSSTPPTVPTSTTSSGSQSPASQSGATNSSVLVGGLPASLSSSPSSWLKPERDQLNLSGLLNVLDGVVDSPGRILIMTTNHVEHLDPALVRPGRIDKKLFLGYMAAIDVIAMLEHYFQMTLSGEQRERVEKAMKGVVDAEQQPTKPQARVGRQRQPLSLTPAQIEQMTAEYDEIEDMIQALEAQSRKKNTR